MYQFYLAIVAFVAFVLVIAGLFVWFGVRRYDDEAFIVVPPIAAFGGVIVGVYTWQLVWQMPYDTWQASTFSVVWIIACAFALGFAAGWLFSVIDRRWPMRSDQEEAKVPAPTKSVTKPRRKKPQPVVAQAKAGHETETRVLTQRAIPLGDSDDLKVELHLEWGPRGSAT